MDKDLPLIVKGVMARKILPTATTVVLASFLATAAIAHPALKVSDPPAGGTVTQAPTEIRMSFSEAVIPKFSGVDLRSASGLSIPTATASSDPADNKKLVVPIKGPLQPGSYEVDWHAVSADTHRVKGHFSFTIGR